MRRAASRRSIRRRRIRHPGLVADHYESARLGVRRRPLAACRRETLLRVFGPSAYDRRMSSSVEDDPRRLADVKAKEIAGLSWEELDAYGRRVEDVVTATGRRLRVTSQAFWDKEEWDSTMYVIVKVYPLAAGVGSADTRPL
jgi:hypothetical protein